MNCSQLISILSSNNEHILYLASVLKPQKITFLIPTELGYIKYLEGVREVLIQILPGYVQEIEVYGDLTDSVNNYLYKLIGRQGVYLDLTNGPKKDLFLFQVQALANGIPTIFADIPRHRIYTVDSQGMLNFEK